MMRRKNRKNRTRKSRKNRILHVIFVLYMIVLMFVLIFKFPTGMVSETFRRMACGETVIRAPMQLTPFKTIIDYASQVHSLTDWFIKNLACNIIMFVPLGFLLPMMEKNKSASKRGKNRKKVVMKTVMSGIGLSVLIEIFQYITCLGQCDIDDVILNALGTIIGVYVWQLSTKIFKKKK